MQDAQQPQSELWPPGDICSELINLCFVSSSVEQAYVEAPLALAFIFDEINAKAAISVLDKLPIAHLGVLRDHTNKSSHPKPVWNGDAIQEGQGSCLQKDRSPYPCRGDAN